MQCRVIGGSTRSLWCEPRTQVTQHQWEVKLKRRRSAGGYLWARDHLKPDAAPVSWHNRRCTKLGGCSHLNELHQRAFVSVTTSHLWPKHKADAGWEIRIWVAKALWLMTTFVFKFLYFVLLTQSVTQLRTLILFRWRKTQKVSQKIMARLKAWVRQWAAVTSDEAGRWPNLEQRNTNWIIIIHGCRAILERDYNPPGALATRPAERGSSESPHNLKGPALEAAIITGESPYLEVKAFLLESRGDEGTRQILGIYVPQSDQCTVVGPSRSLGWQRDLETQLWRQFSQTRHKVTSKPIPYCHQTMTITTTLKQDTLPACVDVVFHQCRPWTVALLLRLLHDAQVAGSSNPNSIHVLWFCCRLFSIAVCLLRFLLPFVCFF